MTQDRPGTETTDVFKRTGAVIPCAFQSPIGKSLEGSEMDIMSPVRKLFQVSSRLGEEQQRRESGEILFRRHTCQNMVVG